MRALVQRVSRASVKIEGRLHASISAGILIFLGIESSDTHRDADWLARKLAALRIFSDPDGKMNLSVWDVQGSVLVVSQFTLMASTKKGTRPSFVRAAPPEVAVPLYEHFNETLGSLIQSPVSTGVFGANMQVSLCNDGPVTLLLDSDNPE